MSKRFRPVPAEAVVTSPYGPRWGTIHRGVDFGRNGGAANMPVYAAQGGTVVYTGPASGFGGPDPAGWVVIDHPTADGSGTTVYGHVIREVKVGDRVEAGQRIARVNPDSRTNGGVAPHLHFEVHPTVWRAGSQIDPLPWLGGAPTPGQARHRKPNDVEGVIFGVDVSEHQNGMPLTVAAREGMKFAIIRTTDGTYKDKVYRSHVDDARRTDMVLAAYHYLRNPNEGTTVEQQVAASLEVMGKDHRLPVWLDVETPAGLHVDHIRRAKAAYEGAGIRVIGAYSYVPYWEGRISPGEPDSHEFGAFWVAAYGANRHGTPAELYPGNSARQWTYPLGNQRPAVWQFGSNARVAGFSVDINAFRGTKEQLRTLFYGDTAPKNPPVKAPETPAPKQDTPAPPPVYVGPVEGVPEREWPPRLDVEPPQEQDTPAPPPHQDTDPEDTGYTRPVARRSFWDLLLDALVSLIVGRRPR